jgi:hypothetical protein
MNRITNALLFFIFIPILALSIFIGFDLPIELFKTTGKSLPYKAELFLGFGFLVGIVGSNRSIKRWVGWFTLRQKSRFKFTTPISQERKQRVLVYSILEVSISAILAFALYSLTREALVCSLLFALFSFDGLLFISVGLPAFGVGVSSKAILVVDREVTVAYLSGLRKVSVSQQTLYLDYLNNLQLTFPINCIPDSEKNAFILTLESVTDRDRVLIQNLSTWKT